MKKYNFVILNEILNNSTYGIMEHSWEVVLNHEETLEFSQA